MCDNPYATESKPDHSRPEAKWKAGAPPPHSVFREGVGPHYLKLCKQKEEEAETKLGANTRADNRTHRQVSLYFCSYE